MESLEITFKGRVPSKKNSKKVVCRGSRPYIFPSEAYEAWQKEQMYRLRGYAKVPKVGSIHMKFFPPDRLKSDLTNKAESVMDVLVDAGIIEDDNWFEIGALYLEFGEVDRENPRVVVTINL